MIKNLLIAAIAILGLTSCSKNNDDNGFYFSAKIDGVKKEFKNYMWAQLDGSSITTEHSLIVNASGGNDATLFPLIYVNVKVDAPVEAKTYQTIQSQSKLEAYGFYSPDMNTDYYMDGQDFIVTVTSISSKNVKGTFSGTLKETSTGHIITITEGSFSAPMIP